MGLGETRQPLPSLQTLDTFNQCKTMSATTVNICLWLCFHSAEQVLGWVGTLLAVQGLRLCVHWGGPSLIPGHILHGAAKVKKKK